MALRVVLISENAMARSGITAALREHGDVQMIGVYDDCRSALPHVMKAPPDAVIHELGPGGGDVLDAIARCATAYPDIAHLVISQTRDGHLAERAIKAGARAFVYKNIGPSGLLTALRDAVAGRLHLCPCIASPMIHEKIYGKGKHKQKHPDLAKLSDREFQVFQLIGAGWDNQNIAETLGISVKTLNVHKEHLKDRLGLSTTGALKSAATEWQARRSLVNIY
jgi:DNA-binding NarL/FixJ family response regulator